MTSTVQGGGREGQGVGGGGGGGGGGSHLFGKSMSGPWRSRQN